MTTLEGAQVGILLRTAVYTPRGKLVQEHIQPGHSFVLAFAAIFNNLFSEAGQLATIPDTGNTSRTLASGNQVSGLRVDAAAAEATFGIVVGTGTNAVAMTDYALQTRIDEGTSSGQLSHLAVAFGPLGTATTARYINIIRTFQNNSGATISPTEAALYAEAPYTGPVIGIFCIARDLISASVGAGQLLVVQYQLAFNLT